MYTIWHRTFGVDDGTRTHDDRNHNPGLYQLSYAHHKTFVPAAPSSAARRTVNGAPGRNRTCNPRLRRPMLYPVELRALHKLSTRCRVAPGPCPASPPWGEPGTVAGLVGVEGFEPPPSCSQSRRATRLRYTPRLSCAPRCRGPPMPVKGRDSTRCRYGRQFRHVHRTRGSIPATPGVCPRARRTHACAPRQPRATIPPLIFPLFPTSTVSAPCQPS